MRLREAPAVCRDRSAEAMAAYDRRDSFTVTAIEAAIGQCPRREPGVVGCEVCSAPSRAISGRRTRDL